MIESAVAAPARQLLSRCTWGEKMIKRVAAAAMSFLTIGAAVASGQPCNWQFVEKSDDGRLQLHFNSCSVKTKGSTASVWVRYTYGWDFYYKQKRVRAQKQLWIFDCANQRFAATRQVFYNMHYKPYAFVSHYPPTFTEEDSIVDSIGKKVCPKTG